MQTKGKISVVIPCYNEEGNVRKIYEAVIEQLSNYNFQLLFVDDCSMDRTLNIIKELNKSDNRVDYISFSRNFGQISGLRAGLEYANGDCVISLDADMQHPPELIPKMIKKWEEGYDIVSTLRKDFENVSFFKKLTSSLFYRVFNKLSDIQIKPGAADFRLLDRKIVEILVRDLNEYHYYLKGLVNWVGFNHAEIEYEVRERFSGQTKYSISKLINLAIEGITSFSIKPLKLAILLGFSLSVFSAVYSFYAIYMALFTDETVKGWTSVLVSILFIGGVNMILLGIIGEYLGKLYIQSKNRPLFLIKETNIK